jgi:hypothetical protein
MSAASLAEGAGRRCIGGGAPNTVLRIGRGRSTKPGNWPRLCDEHEASRKTEAVMSASSRQFAPRRKLDCFAACAPRNDVENSSIQFSNIPENMRPHSRGAITRAVLHRFARREGAGNAGCLLHPRSRVQDALRNAHTSIQVQTEHPDVPCAVALRLMPSSPRRRIRLASVAVGLMTDRSGWIKFATDSLAPATGVGTTRFCRTLSAIRLARTVCSR